MRNRLRNRSLRWCEVPCLLIALCLWCACDGRPTVYDRFCALPVAGWGQTDTLRFEAALTDSNAVYRLFVGVRYRNSYLYRNLPLNIGCVRPDSVPPLSAGWETVDVMLADAQGIWQGKGWGGLYQQERYVGILRTGRAGTYTFCVSHALADTLLRGINDVGIRLERLPEPSLHQPSLAPRVDAQEDEQQDGEAP